MIKQIRNSIVLLFSIFSVLVFAGCQNSTPSSSGNGGSSSGNNSNSLSAPQWVQAEAGEYTHYVKITWKDNGSAYYWLYYNTVYDPSTATCQTKSLRSLTASLGYSMLLKSSGTYYFWIKAADGKNDDSATSDFNSLPCSYNFTYTPLSAPTGVTVTASTSQDKVNISCQDNGSHYYYIYYNTINDSSSAILEKRTGHLPYEMTLPSSGTYYFWIKSADEISKTSATSDFSAVASYTY